MTQTQPDEPHPPAPTSLRPTRDQNGGQNGDKTRVLERDIARVQVQIILDAFEGEVAVGYPRGYEGGDGGGGDDLADFEYLYHRDRILVRDGDVERVRAVVGGGDTDGSDDRAGNVNGLTRFRLPTDTTVPDALLTLDGALGVGVATPDHVMWVTPKSYACPATEPEETTATTPYPGVSRHRHAGSGVMVSVVDTGLWRSAVTDPITPWLEGVDGDDEVFDEDAIPEYAGHGTFIAGVVRCEAPATEIRVEGYLTRGGAILESEIVQQLIEGLALGPDIISLSAGSTTRESLPLLSFEVFYANFLSQVKHTVLVAAAGNAGTRRPFWPAAFPWSVSVGAIDGTGQRADFSNYGSWVDVYALGVDLVNAFPHGTYRCVQDPDKDQERHFRGLCQWSGTSFSTPLVAGKIAARMSATGLSARHAADELLAEARAHAVPGVGPVL